MNTNIGDTHRIKYELAPFFVFRCSLYGEIKLAYDKTTRKKGKEAIIQIQFVSVALHKIIINKLLRMK